MNKLRFIKSLSSIALMVCFFFPLSQCSKQPDTISNPDAQIQSETTTDKNQENINYLYPYYPYKEIEEMSNLNSLIIISAFFFSAPFFVADKLSGRNWKRVVLGVCELSVSGLSVYIIYGIIFFFSTPLFAGYAALASIGIYFIVTLAQVGDIIIFLFRKRKSNKTLQSTPKSGATDR